MLLPGECSQEGVWCVELPSNAYRAWQGLRGLRKIKWSSLCEVLSYADSSHAETNQPPRKKEDRLWRQTLPLELRQAEVQQLDVD